MTFFDARMAFVNCTGLDKSEKLSAALTALMLVVVAVLIIQWDA